MIYAVSISTEETRNNPASEDSIYTVEFVSDTPITQDTVKVGTLVPIKDMPVPTFGVEYIFAQTVTVHVQRDAQTYKTLGDFTEERMPGRMIERVTVTGPLVRNKVEAMARGFYGRIK
jgi:hypothetical protein